MILLDAYALVALLLDEPAASEVEALVQRDEVGITAINLAETIDVACRARKRHEREVRDALEPLFHTGALSVIPLSERLAWRAAALRTAHYDKRVRALSLADCALVAATGTSDQIATADPPVAELARELGLGLVPLPDAAGRRP